MAAEKKRWFIHEPAEMAAREDQRGLEDVLLVLWHGAGGDVVEPSLTELARAFSSAGAVAVRARFAYRLAGKRMPDRMPALIEEAKQTIAALRAEHELAGKTKRLVLGGRSMGGRVASMLAAEGYGVDALIFLGYPLHPAGQPEKMRDAHLPNIRCPMYFMSGDRDELCTLSLLEPVLEKLGARATLELFRGADHSLKQVAPAKLADLARAWTKKALARRS